LLLLRLLFGLPALALMVVAGLALMAVEDHPAVNQAPHPTARDVARAQALLSRHDPRRLPAGARGSLLIGQGEAAIGLAALARYQPDLRAEVDLASRPARLSASLPLAGSGRWVNLGVELHPAKGGIALRNLQVGALAVPDAVTAWAVDAARRQLLEDPEWGPLARSVEAVAVENGRLRVDYRAPGGLPARLGAVLVPPEEVARLAIYHTRLAGSLAATPGVVPLNRLLAPLFAEVTARGGGAEEARAALAVLGFYLAGRSLTPLVPEARAWPPLPRRRVTLAGRVDSAQHWSVSALLAAAVGSPLADAVGLWKELQDSRRGSGFSFADLAADLAGTRAGSALVGPEGPHLARRLAAGAAEETLVPRLGALPENLDQATFRARYGGPGDPRYEALHQQIARQVAALPLGPGDP
jgi:hypothetical protein